MSHHNLNICPFRPQQSPYNRQEIPQQQHPYQPRMAHRGSLQSPSPATMSQGGNCWPINPSLALSHQNTSQPSYSGSVFQQSPNTNTYPYSPSTEQSRSAYETDNEGPWNHLGGPNDRSDFMLKLTRNSATIGSARSVDSGYATRSIADQSMFGANLMRIESGEGAQAHFETVSHGYDRSRALDVQSNMQDSISESSRTSYQPNIVPYDSENIDTVTKDDTPQKKTKKEKPHVCDVPDCPRKNEGFTTKNDLARHKKSVHKISDPADKSFKCIGTNCPKKDKIWPRLDNFRQHVNRVHKRENLDELVKKSQVQVPSEVASNSSFVQYRNGDIARSSSAFVNDSSPNTLSLSAIEGPHSYPKSNFSTISDLEINYPRQNESLEPHGAAGTNHGYYNNRQLDEIASLKGPRTPSPLAITGANESLPLTNSVSHLTNSMATAVINSSDDNAQQAFASQFKSLVKNYSSQIPPQVIQRIFETETQNLLNSGRSSKRTFDDAGLDDASKQPGKQVSCSQCNKKMNRPCDIKKHEKRHDRPYGCTYPSCIKAFGSKNDWKRHENSQHFQQETWRCSHPDLQSKIKKCAKLFFRRENFQSHLRKDHNNQNDEDIREQCRRNRVGRNNNSGFWCGFCQDIIELQKRGLEAWDERFNHIDDLHFKKGLRTSQWYPMDKDVPKGKLSLENNLNADGLLTANSDEDAGNDESETEDTNKMHFPSRKVAHTQNSNPIKRRKYNPTFNPNPSQSSLYPPSHNLNIHPESQKCFDGSKNLWFCCQCTQGPHNTEIQDSCSMCNRHARCYACPTE
ncbi:MAG: hypothetical protein MMC33_001606 [Icmadophila ericetorum]|nr:hypothetical protein [Icmadophila ericetorum]